MLRGSKQCAATAAADSSPRAALPPKYSSLSSSLTLCERASGSFSRVKNSSSCAIQSRKSCLASGVGSRALYLNFIVFVSLLDGKNSGNGSGFFNFARRNRQRLYLRSRRLGTGEHRP